MATEQDTRESASTDPPIRVVHLAGDRAAATATAEFLSDRGVEVRTATDPARGLALAWGHPDGLADDDGDETAVDAAVVDAVLPEIDGVDLLGRLREVRPALPAVVLAADADERPPVETLLSAGANAVVDGHDEDALARLHHRLRAAVDARRHEQAVAAAGEGLAVKDAAGRYRLANDRFATLSDREGVVGATDADLFDPALARRRETTDERARETGRRTDRERFGDGDRPVETTRQPVTGPPGLAVATRDVSGAVEREADLRERLQRLDAFASMVSHDLRGPLDRVEGYVEIARETGDTDYLDEVEDAVARVGEVVDATLAVARAEDATDPEPLELGTAARRAWERSVDDEAATMTADERSLSADPDLLARLLENLFRNAAEHAGPGATVRVGATDAGFYVADDGGGLPEDLRDRAFEPGVTTAQRGTGLGLAVVAWAADAHGWTVEAGESEAGGARFDVVCSPADGDRSAE
jgi:signal transduction histidine kinase